VIFFKPLTKQDEWLWVKKRAKPIQCEDSQGIVAYDEKGQIRACCIADSFTVDGCNVHFAIDSAIVIKYGFFHEVSHHLFNTCGRKRIFGLVPASNAKALKLDMHMGFTEVSRVPNGFAEGVDYVVLMMDRDNRWLKEERPSQIKRAA
jgi:hypothetical protein